MPDYSDAQIKYPDGSPRIRIGEFRLPFPAHGPTEIRIQYWEHGNKVRFSLGMDSADARIVSQALLEVADRKDRMDEEQAISREMAAEDG